MKKLTGLFIFMLWFIYLKAQVVNTGKDNNFYGSLNIGRDSLKTVSGYVPTNAKAWLEIGKWGTNKGIIIPRIMDSLQITGAPQGMMVYFINYGAFGLRLRYRWYLLDSDFPTLQEVLDNGSVLTRDNNIDGGLFNLFIFHWNSINFAKNTPLYADVTRRSVFYQTQNYSYLRQGYVTGDTGYHKFQGVSVDTVSSYIASVFSNGITNYWANVVSVDSLGVHLNSNSRSISMDVDSVDEPYNSLWIDGLNRIHKGPVATGGGASIDSVLLIGDELDTTLTLNGTRTVITLPHGLSYTPSAASIGINDTIYGIPDYTLDATNIKLRYATAPNATITYKIAFHTQGHGGGGGGGGGGEPLFTSSPAYGITTTNKANWSTAYNKRPTAIAFTGTTTKTLTMTLGDATTLTANFTDISGGGGGSSVITFNGRNGDVLPLTGDYTYAQIGSKPTTITGFAADAVSTSGSYSNPAWITGLDYSKIIGVPNFLLANSAITAGTATKITYDSKGLVTFGSNLLAADIPNLDVAKITTGTFGITRGGLGLNTLGAPLQSIRVNSAGTAFEYFTGGGAGTLESFSMGNLSPIFTTTVTGSIGPNTAVTLALNSAAVYSILGNNTATSAPPTYFAPVLTSPLFRNQGTILTVLHGNAAGNPAWGPVDLTDEVTGILPEANGGNGGVIDPSFKALANGATCNWVYSKLNKFNTELTINQNEVMNITGDFDGAYGTLFITQGGTTFAYTLTVQVGDILSEGMGTGRVIALKTGSGAITSLGWVNRHGIRYWNLNQY